MVVSTLFEIECRVDRLGDVAERLQFADRAGQIVGARAQFVEQAHVLDGDDGLVGEVGDQLDLLVGERADLLPINRDRADQLVFLQHRHEKQRSGAAHVGQRHDGGKALPVALVVSDVRNLKRLLRRASRFIGMDSSFGSIVGSCWRMSANAGGSP